MDDHESEKGSSEEEEEEEEVPGLTTKRTSSGGRKERGDGKLYFALYHYSSNLVRSSWLVSKTS